MLIYLPACHSLKLILCTAYIPKRKVHGENKIMKWDRCNLSSNLTFYICKNITDEWMNQPLIFLYDDSKSMLFTAVTRLLWPCSAQKVGAIYTLYINWASSTRNGKKIELSMLLWHFIYFMGTALLGKSRSFKSVNALMLLKQAQLHQKLCSTNFFPF